MNQNEEAAELAEKAAIILMQRGHYKGEYEAEDGRVCLFGALNTVAYGQARSPGYHLIDPAYLLLAIHLERVAARDYHNNAVHWNDAEETSAEDIILVLKTIAEELRA